MQSGGHRGFSLHSLPKKYPRTPQQQKMIDALEFCGIKKGITKTELMLKMKNCLPKYYREAKKSD